MELKRSQQGTGPAHGTRSGRPIAAWLLACCALVFAMVAVGGVTRLTHSGLSIVEWQPIVGAVPPLNEQQWLETFEKYQRTPEFKLVNHAMTVSEFKGIFWWEYFHRLLGRLIGVVFLLPLLWFALRRRIDHRLGIRLVGIFALGAAQGAMGWYMVKSGLVDDPRVSQFRLTAHLGLAFLILAAMLWVALDQLRPRPVTDARTPATNGNARAPRRLAWWVTGISAYMVLTGGLVAGIRAGYAYNTFPLMNGQIVPAEIAMLAPWWKNFFYNMATVQFDHRLGGLGARGPRAAAVAAAAPRRRGHTRQNGCRRAPLAGVGGLARRPAARAARAADRSGHLDAAQRRRGAARGCAPGGRGARVRRRAGGESRAGGATGGCHRCAFVGPHGGEREHDRMKPLRAAIQFLFLRLEAVGNRIFGERLNPLYYLGASSFWMFWVVAASGLYVYAFYETGVDKTYASMDSITHGQWYAGGVMSSVHRYASDAMVLTMLLHMLRHFAFDRYRGFRAFSWVSGVVAAVPALRLRASTASCCPGTASRSTWC